MNRTDKRRTNTHDDTWLDFARGLMPRSRRHAAGAGLVDMLRELERTKYAGHERHYATPWAATSAGGFSREVWMLEEPFRKMPKGTVVALPSKAEWLDEAGAKLTKMRYPKDKALYRTLKARVPDMRDLRLPEQFGALTRRDAYAAVRRHSRARVSMLVRLSDETVDMPKRDVIKVFERVFLVNGSEASKIASLCTDQSRLYRGCPLARTLVEIRTAECVKRLKSLCDSVGARITDYAGEILITHEFWEYFSAGFRKTVARIVHECGLELADDGITCSRISPRGNETGSITGLTLDFDVLGWPYVRPLKRARQLRHIG